MSAVNPAIWYIASNARSVISNMWDKPKILWCRDFKPTGQTFHPCTPQQWICTTSVQWNRISLDTMSLNYAPLWYQHHGQNAWPITVMQKLEKLSQINVSCHQHPPNFNLYFFYYFLLFFHRFCPEPIASSRQNIQYGFLAKSWACRCPRYGQYIINYRV